MASEIYIKYTVDTEDLKKATSIWDKLTQEEQDAISKLKEFNLQLKTTGTTAGALGSKIRDLGAVDSFARLKDKAAGLRREMELLSPASATFADKLKQLKGVEKDLGGMNKALGEGKQGMGGMMDIAEKFIPALKIIGSLKALQAIANEALQASMAFNAMQRGLEAATGSSLGTGRAIDFVTAMSQRLGLNLIETGNAYKSFAAAGRSAGLEINAQEKIFESVAEAGMKMGLTTDQIQGAMLALTQMMSKGTVQAEELRGQLGERIPGAFGIMARAVGVSERELGKMLEKGEVIAKDVLPKFAEELNKTFGGGNGELINNTTAATSRLDTAWTGFLKTIGDKLEPAYKKGLEATADFINGVKRIISDEAPDTTSQFTVVKNVQRDFQILLKSKQELIDTAIRYEKEGLVKLAQMERARIPENTQILSSLLSKYTQDFKKQTGKSLKDYEDNLKLFQIGLDPTKWDNREENAAFVNLGDVDKYKILFNKLAEVRRLTTEEAKNLGKEFSKPPVDEKALKKAAKDAAKGYSEMLADIASREKIAQSERKAATKAGVIEQMLQQEDLLKITMKFNKEREAAAAQYGQVPAARRDAAELVATQTELNADLVRLEDERLAKLKEMNAQDVERSLKVMDDANRRENELVVTLTKDVEEQNLLKAQNDLKYANRKLQLLDLLKEKQIAISVDTYQAVTDSIAKGEVAVTDATLKLIDNTYLKAKAKLEEQGSNEGKKMQSPENVRFKSAAKLNKELIEGQIATNEKIIALADESSLKGSEKAKKDADAVRAENIKLQGDLVKIDKEIYEERQKTALAAVDLAAQVTNQSFDLYKAQLDNELSAANKRFDEEVRLADGNKQKLNEIEEKRRQKEAEIKKKQFEANKIQAIANVVFGTAPLIAQYLAGVLTGPLAIIALAAQAAQIGFILAQPTPEFAEGTKGKKFRGGRAMVGERGTEKIITESGKVYFTPPTATLMDLPKGVQIVPNHLLNQQEIAYATMSKSFGGSMRQSNVEDKLTEIGGILKGLPIHQITMDERGFQKFIKTESRSTKVLNNKFPQNYA